MSVSRPLYIVLGLDVLGLNPEFKTIFNIVPGTIIGLRVDDGEKTNSFNVGGLKKVIVISFRYAAS
jgi:hypothetical protein